ncbi:MAG: HEAT repeat domain-containing protein, partial [Chloroflexota bacterium]|nr:HEAT repeat domain-containing protein [Chloroflexota bacterium]
MGRTADPRWLPRVSAEFANEDAELRFEAARAAGELGDVDTIPTLIDLAQDEDVEVRHAAIGAIGRIGGREAARVLRRLAEDAPESDGDAIEDAIHEADTSLDPLVLDR